MYQINYTNISNKTHLTQYLGNINFRCFSGRPLLIDKKNGRCPRQRPSLNIHLTTLDIVVELWDIGRCLSLAQEVL